MPGRPSKTAGHARKWLTSINLKCGGCCDVTPAPTSDRARVHSTLRGMLLVLLGWTLRALGEPLVALLSSSWMRSDSTRSTAPHLHLPDGPPISFVAPPPPVNLTREALMALPGNFSLAVAHEPSYGVTAVVSFYRRAWTLPVMVKRLLGSTVPPREIWLVAFASDIEDELEREHRALDTDPEVVALRQVLGGSAPPVNFMRGGIHLSYFGRFQVALAAPTPFVAVWDDDTVPGTKLLHTLLHMAHTDVGRGRVIGARGHSFQCPMLQPFAMSARSPIVVEEDVIGGFWFARTEMLRLLFRDRIVSWATSEDSTFCAAVRKYTGQPCLVAPQDPRDPATTTQEESHDVRGREGDTTVTTNKMPLRTSITRAIFKRGTVLRDRRLLQVPGSVLVLVDDCESAGRLAAVVAGAVSHLDPASFFVALTGACTEARVIAQMPPGVGNHSWNTLDCPTAASCAWGPRPYGFFDLDIGGDLPFVRQRPSDVLADSLLAAQTLLELLAPRVVLLAHSVAPSVLGAALASHFLRVPVLTVGGEGSAGTGSGPAAGVSSMAGVLHRLAANQAPLPVAGPEAVAALVALVNRRQPPTTTI